MSEEKEVLKHICISKISVEGNTLARHGSVETGSTYPEDPFTGLEIKKSDFDDEPEDYHRIMIILTRVARRKVTAMLSFKDANKPGNP